jgi:hypothetical protein
MKSGLVLTIPNFLTNPEEELEKAKTAEYKDYQFTGVTYPNIAVSALNATEVQKLEDALGEPLTCVLPPFYRLYTPKDDQPTYVHTDGLISDYTLIIFLNQPEDCYGGTAFWKHKSLSVSNYSDNLPPELLDFLMADSYNTDAWDLQKVVPMEHNKALLFDSSWYHSRYPQSVPRNRHLKVCFLKVLKDGNESSKRS